MRASQCRDRRLRPRKDLNFPLAHRAKVRSSENLNRYVTGRTASSSESGELPYREGGEAGHFPHRGVTKNGTKTGPVGGRFFPFEVEHNRKPRRAYRIHLPPAVSRANHRFLDG